MLALAALLGLAHAIATPAFWPVDETSHVAYAEHLVAEGDLPRIDTPIPRDLPYPGVGQRQIWERNQEREGRQDIWTANHPPLPYAVQAVALRIGGWAAGGDGAIMLARLTSVAWLVAGVWLTMHLAHLLAPRPRTKGRDRAVVLPPATVAVAAGAIVATTPTLTHLSGLVFNDVPAYTLSTACLLAGATIAFRGPDTRRVLLLGLVCGAAALTRVSCLPAIAVAGLLLLYGTWRHGLDVPRRRLPLLLTLAALPTVPAALFWWRNVVLYGDLTASAELLSKFDRDLNAPVGELVGDRLFWLRLWNRMLGDLTTGHWGVGTRATITELLLVVILLACLVGLWRIRPRRRVPSPTLGQLVRSPRAAVWVIGMLLPAALLVSTIQFHAAGGSLHGRYVLGGYAMLATGIVIALAQLPRVGRAAALGMPAALLVVNSFLLEALSLHHSLTWTRRSVSMVLPQLTGSATRPLVQGLVAVAAGLLAVSLVQHHQPLSPRKGRYGATPPRRAIKESAAA